MFDDREPEPGKLHRGFLTDKQGRRIYFPPFGPARWVPSAEEEAAFKERALVWMTGAFFLACVILFVLIFTIDTYRGGGHVVVIGFGGKWLGEGLMARRWPLMDDRTITYQQAVINDLMQRSTVRLCFMVCMTVLSTIFFIVLPVWGFGFGPVVWSERSTVEVIVSVYLTTALCAVFAIYLLRLAHRMNRRPPGEAERHARDSFIVRRAIAKTKPPAVGDSGRSVFGRSADLGEGVDLRGPTRE